MSVDSDHTCRRMLEAQLWESSKDAIGVGWQACRIAARSNRPEGGMEGSVGAFFLASRVLRKMLGLACLLS